MKPPLPADEAQRLEALHSYNILDTLPEQCFDDISQLASEICGTPIALVSFVDSDRQWFKSRKGFETTESSRDIAFCAHTILETDVLVVPDARNDIRFADNPLVTHAPALRFYAGAPLVTPGGHALGTLCVLDRNERTITPAQIDALRALSRQVMAQLDLRVHVAAQKRLQAELRAHQQRLEELNVHLEAASLTDDVTGFHNTRFLHQHLDRLLVTAKQEQMPLSLAFFDMDQFKTVVDTHGHLLGARVLREVAEAIDQDLDPRDRIVRYGGDEFVVILPNQDTDAALAKVERMKERISATSFLPGDGIGLRVTASFGVATFPDDASSKVQLLAQADQSLFRSKTLGRNRVTHARMPQQI
jgi:diguanylate cyclase (GGDEF)-like protein